MNQYHLKFIKTIILIEYNGTRSSQSSGSNERLKSQFAVVFATLKIILSLPLLPWKEFLAIDIPSHWGFWKLWGPQTCWQRLLLPRHQSSQKQEGSSSGCADLEIESKQRAFWSRKLGFGFSTEQCGIGKAPWDSLRRRGTMRWMGGSMKFLHTVRIAFQSLESWFRKLLSFLCLLHRHASKMWT